MATVKRAKVTRNDIALWDGVTKTVTRSDASGGTVTGLTVGDHVDVLQVFGSGTQRTVTAINNALNHVSTSTVSFLFATGTWTIDDDLTIPSTVTCHIPAGCVFDVSSGKTLTFSGLINTEYPTNWTSGSGTVVVSNEGSHFGVRHPTAAERSAAVTIVNHQHIAGHVLRYGDNDTPGTTNMATAIQAAIDQAESGGDRVTAPPNTYAVSTALTISASIVFDLAGSTIFQLVGSDLTTVLTVTPGNTGTLYMRGRVDGNKANNTAVNGIIFNGPATGWADVNVAAKDCDVGITVQANTETNVFFFDANGCDIGVLEKDDTTNGTPDENTIFVTGHNNVTDYKKNIATGFKTT